MLRFLCQVFQKSNNNKLFMNDLFINTLFHDTQTQTLSQVAHVYFYANKHELLDLMENLE